MRAQAHAWCCANRALLDVSPEKLTDIATPSVGDVAINSLANVLGVEILVVYNTRTSTEKQLFQPRDRQTTDIYPILFDLRGHYDALVSTQPPPLTTIQTVGEACLTSEPKRRKRGKPLGPTQQRQRLALIPFKDMALEERQKMMLSWLVDSEDIQRAMDGEILGEDCVEVRPDCLSKSILDNNVNFHEVQSFFTEDAWATVVTTVRVKKASATWRCSTCSRTLEEGKTSLACDRCLQWQHLLCAGFIRPQQRKT